MNAEGEVRFWARSLRNPLAWALAALSALWFLLFSQSSSPMQTMAPSAGGTFAKALCLGLAACGAMGVLLCVKDSYREKSLKAASPRFFAFLTGFGGLCTAVGFLAGFWSPPGAMPLIGGAFAGFGFGCVVVATFVIVPYFPLESTGAVFYEMVGFVRSASIFIFVAGLMAVLTAAARTADASLPFACALALMLSGLCLCAGFGMARAFGAAANAVVVLMFVAYLVAVVIVRSVAHGDEQKVRALEREVFDAYLNQRCAVIAERYELSPRESEMLAWLSRGHGYVYIAQLAFVSEGTVRTHAKNIFRKCSVSSREELIDLVDERPLP